jgi:hypothetical protein
MAITYNTSCVTSGLVLSLDFGNIKCYPGSGTTVTDLTRSKYTGTVFNGATFSSGAFTFDGSNDYIGMPSPSARWNWTPFASNTLNEMSIEIWVKTTDTAGQYFSKPWNGNGEYNYRADNGGWFTQVVTSGSSQFHNQTFTSLATGNWEHAVFIVNATQKAVYRNGVINAAYTNHSITNIDPTTGNGGEDLSLMTLYPYGTGVWDQPTHAINGQMAVFRIYNKVMTDEEVLRNFNSMRGRFGV